MSIFRSRARFLARFLVKSSSTAYCDFGETFSMHSPIYLPVLLSLCIVSYFVCPSFPALSSEATNLAIF